MGREPHKAGLRHRRLGRVEAVNEPVTGTSFGRFASNACEIAAGA
jgi:hypothetical protein